MAGTAAAGCDTHSSSSLAASVCGRRAGDPPRPRDDCPSRLTRARSGPGGEKLGRIGGRSLRGVSCDVPRPAQRRIPFDPAPEGHKHDIDHAARDFTRSHRGILGCGRVPGVRTTADPALTISHLLPSMGYIPQYILVEPYEKASLDPGRRQYRSASRHHGRRRGRPIVAGPPCRTLCPRRTLSRFGANGGHSLPIDSIFRRCDRFRALNTARVKDLGSRAWIVRPSSW